ncbi:MAG: hypothetical protein AAB467_04870 [Patescibacteria group bacterium]
MRAISKDKKLIEDSVNRAFGLVVNELRLVALRKNEEVIVERIMLSRLVIETQCLYIGQFRHLADVAATNGSKPVNPTKLDAANLLPVMKKMARLWGARILGKEVEFVVDKPRRPTLSLCR